VPRRTYDSPTRREKARRTESAILAAARDLLQSQGWLGTTMTAIAARAGVSAQLLYKTYGTKVALAKRLYDVTLIGDNEPAPLSQRPQIAAIIAEPDPRRKVALYVHLGRVVTERVGRLLATLRAAATAGDADVADLITTTDRERLAGAEGFVRHLAAADALRPGLTMERATDAVWILLNPAILLQLTDDRGWTPDQAEEWLTNQLHTALLP
jgi:AcrR family transcriptional regulator